MRHSSTTASNRRSIRRSARAWVARAAVRADGTECGRYEEPSVVFFAVCVHKGMSTDIVDRLDLMRKIGSTFRSEVPAGTESLWVFPGGYFGFNASLGNWAHLDDAALARIRQGVARGLDEFAEQSTIAFGVDSLIERRSLEAPRQQVWIARRTPRPLLAKITRGESALADRLFRIGPLNAAFFVCGEFTGSKTDENGPFCEGGRGGLYLTNPAAQLPSSTVLVDLAHREVSGSVSELRNRRMVHQLQMDRFASHGPAILAHHHSGRLSAGRPHFKHQSNWIVFRGGRWLEAKKVVQI